MAPRKFRSKRFEEEQKESDLKTMAEIGMPCILRVKRKRDEEAIDQICKETNMTNDQEYRY